MNFVRFVVLPVGFFGVAVIALVFGLWVVAGISGILLLYFLLLIRREYGIHGSRADRRWLDRFAEGWANPSGLGLFAVGAILLLVATGYGLSIGVGIGAGMWALLLGTWVVRRLRLPASDG